MEGTITVDQAIQADDSGGIELKSDDGLTRVKVGDTGHVGIGIDSPATRLHVKGTGPASSYVRVDDQNSLVQTVLGAEGSQFYGFGGTLSDHPFILRTNNAEAARLTTDGRMGIGTTAPETTLHVDGEISTGGGGLRWQVFSGTTDNDDFTNLTTSIDPTKIVMMSAVARYSGGSGTSYWPTGYSGFVSGYTIDIGVENGTIVLMHDIHMQGEPYRAVVMYVD